MKHDFKAICYDVDALLEGVETLAQFMRRLIKQSETKPDYWPPMEYRGKGFEAFVEVLINASPIDKRIGIVGYVPVLEDDMGVDGEGASFDGKPHTVQVKFRSNTTKQLTANQDHISNFVAKSLSMHKGEDIDMTIFTTAKDLLEPVNQGMYHGQVRTLGVKELKRLVDKNPAFWSLFRKELTKS
jgi:hypothetical protein